MWKKKNKNEITAKPEADMKEIDKWLQELEESSKEANAKMEAILKEAKINDGKEYQSFRFTSHSKFLEHNLYRGTDNGYLKEKDYMSALDTFDSKVSIIRNIFDQSKRMTIGLCDGIKKFIKIVRKNNATIVPDIERLQKDIDQAVGQEIGKVKDAVKDLSYVTFDEIQSHRHALGFTVKIVLSKLSLSKGPFECIFADVNNIQKLNDKCKSYENDANLPWSVKGLKEHDSTGIGLGVLIYFLLHTPNSPLPLYLHECVRRLET
jgi:uncharacterized protein YoxC